MKVLLVGGGGREHALAWKIAASPLLSLLVCAPGNPGMATMAECAPVAATDVEGQVALARRMGADLVVVGPEAALAAGLVDRMGQAGLTAFGPTAAAARIETSKAFMKALARREHIPTADYEIFHDAATARRRLEESPPPWVIKADGLASGKGVAVAEIRAEAEAAIDSCLALGGRIVIEAFLDGREASHFALSDGRAFISFGAASDHKRLLDGDEGPNTGGMGTFSPSPALPPAIAERAEREIVAPALDALAAEGSSFRGALYSGLMVGPQGPKLVEFNARFGDPESQVLMLRLASDILPYLAATAHGDLADLPEPVWRAEAAVCVVMAARGYPEAPKKGGEIAGLDEAAATQGVTVFHAGTARRGDGALIAVGGRVLNVCALGVDLAEARARAYAAIEKIAWSDGIWRRDIAAAERLGADAAASLG